MNQGLSTLVLIVSGIYAQSRNISELEIEVNKGTMSSGEALKIANGYIDQITMGQGFIFRLGMVLIPILGLVVSYTILKKKYRIDEEEYEKLIQK